MLDITISILTFVLVFLVAGNNLAACVGTLIASSIIRKRTALVLAIAGYLAGLLAQGSLLGFSFYSIMPYPTHAFIEIALLVAIFIFAVVHVKRVSHSLSITFATTLIGISLAAGQPINFYFVAFMIGFWIIAPVASLAIADLSMRVMPKLQHRKNVWAAIAWIRFLLLIVSFLAAFTLGANTIGLIYASVKAYTNIYVLVVAVVTGSLMIGAGEIRRLGSEIVSMRYLNSIVSQTISVAFAEAATLISIPLSNTQTFAASIYGTGLSYKTNLFIKKTGRALMMNWIAAAVASMIMGYLITFLLLK